MLGVLPGIMGSLQATEAIKLLLGIGDTLAGRLLLYDALEMRFQRGQAAPRPRVPGLRRARRPDRAHRLRAVLRDADRSTPMSVTVRLPPVLRVDAGGARERRARCAGRPAGSARGPGHQFPGLRQKLLDDDGDLNRFVNAYVDREDVRLREGLDTSLADGSTVIVMPAMAGGAR